ncbi:nuclear transport factor 2 family protein [Halopiger aswanensis]|uniref:Ketosteroid isomerase-like protein n=1 Tax=Halopiger aswanensis TaxID=148449 RepID=A0A3R7GM37_9EURY|nr:nuclear transport factor 2 family protein [Halopiger aswanensis]RKD98399.1 ketosteroid isomerase-like protein [Halopiger aswanensis]
MVDSDSETDTDTDSDAPTGTDSNTSTATSADPESVVRDYYEYVDAERYDDLVDLFADDVRYERPGQGAITGREELREFYLDGRPLEEGSHEVHDIVVEEDTVAVRGSFTGLQGDERVAFDFADFHEFEDGKISRRYTFTDRDEV